MPSSLKKHEQSSISVHLPENITKPAKIPDENKINIPYNIRQEYSSFIEIGYMQGIKLLTQKTFTDGLITKEEKVVLDNLADRCRFEELRRLLDAE